MSPDPNPCPPLWRGRRGSQPSESRLSQAQPGHSGPVRPAPRPTGQTCVRGTLVIGTKRPWPGPGGPASGLASGGTQPARLSASWPACQRPGRPLNSARHVGWVWLNFSSRRATLQVEREWRGGGPRTRLWPQTACKVRPPTAEAVDCRPGPGGCGPRQMPQAVGVAWHRVAPTPWSAECR